MGLRLGVKRGVCGKVDLQIVCGWVIRNLRYLRSTTFEDFVQFLLPPKCCYGGKISVGVNLCAMQLWVVWLAFSSPSISPISSIEDSDEIIFTI